MDIAINARLAPSRLVFAGLACQIEPLCPRFTQSRSRLRCLIRITRIAATQNGERAAGCFKRCGQLAHCLWRHRCALGFNAASSKQVRGKVCPRIMFSQRTKCCQKNRRRFAGACGACLGMIAQMFKWRGQPDREQRRGEGLPLRIWQSDGRICLKSFAATGPVACIRHWRWRLGKLGKFTNAGHRNFAPGNIFAHGFARV